MDVLNELPEKYRKPVLIGYLSLILLALGVLLNGIVTKIYGTINGNWEGHLIVGIMLMMGIFCFYFLIKTFRVKDEKAKKHINLINILFVTIVILNFLLIP